jgi:8-oxo-dGTP pyrophosphatase MutT (NUDIX family)
MLYLKLFEEFGKKLNKLSGVAVIVDGSILLVLPKKFKRSNTKWSIPKGHIEGGDSLTSALTELREETGVMLDRDFDYNFKVNYKKSGIKKELEIFVYNKEREDLSEFLKGNKLALKGKTVQKVLKSGEIYDVKFYPFRDAWNVIEDVQKQIIDNIDIGSDYTKVEESVSNKSKFVWIHGLPGSGKTNLANEINKDGNFVILDDIMDISKINKELEEGNDIILVSPYFDNYMGFSLDVKLKDVLNGFDYDVEEIWFKNDPEKCIDNLRSRSEHNIKSYLIIPEVNIFSSKYKIPSDVDPIEVWSKK